MAGKDTEWSTDRELSEHSDSRYSERSNARWDGQMDVVEIDDHDDKHHHHSEIMRDQRSMLILMVHCYCHVLDTVDALRL